MLINKKQYFTNDCTFYYFLFFATIPLHLLAAKYLGHTKIDKNLNTYSHMYKNKLSNIIGLIDNLNDKANEEQFDYQESKDDGMEMSL